ncbi:uncharacterized protein LOC110977916 [Acanthaster planci]|uniref:Uncharacterized protein LOC110977916 n=1 Tax=Acanthaster planci TaxID=133434 RepID=A0A8B7Y4M5_ACAPL|nr:uncharacterized protein LOC110977916 [Acanthaster planci]XP_022088142.1 uncharacterized protein LOC110977916 [Acanthaster planci]XP_022088143.1 uncharacterized protein LOC110977916 [Acanthaster planci]
MSLCAGSEKTAVFNHPDDLEKLHWTPKRRSGKKVERGWRALLFHTDPSDFYPIGYPEEKYRRHGWREILPSDQNRASNKAIGPCPFPAPIPISVSAKNTLGFSIKNNRPTAAARATVKAKEKATARKCNQDWPPVSKQVRDGLVFGFIRRLFRRHINDGPPGNKIDNKSSGDHAPKETTVKKAKNPGSKMTKKDRSKKMEVEPAAVIEKSWSDQVKASTLAINKGREPGSQPNDQKDLIRSERQPGVDTVAMPEDHQLSLPTIKKSCQYQVAETHNVVKARFIMVKEAPSCHNFLPEKKVPAVPRARHHKSCKPRREICDIVLEDIEECPMVETD